MLRHACEISLREECKKSKIYAIRHEIMQCSQFVYEAEKSLIQRHFSGGNSSIFRQFWLCRGLFGLSKNFFGSIMPISKNALMRNRKDSVYERASGEMLGECTLLFPGSLQQGYPQTENVRGSQKKAGSLQNKVHQSQDKWHRGFLGESKSFWPKNRQILCGGQCKAKDEMGEIYEQT